MKKIFEMIGLLSLIFFSFFYTNKISLVIKNEDDILKQIEEIKDQYKIDYIDALVNKNTIIPGVSGSKINIKKSYNKMKKVNSFNSNLLVYDEIKPSISVSGVYDKYIISGNKNKKEVSLSFLLKDNDSLNKILEILNSYNIKATFYMDEYWFEDNTETVFDLIKNSHIVGFLESNSNNDSSLTWMNGIVNKIAKQKDTYCYNKDYNDIFLNQCKLNQSYTIKPSIVVESNPLIEIKNNIENGSIISLDVNDKLLKELKLIIEYINHKDLQIVTIEKLLEE